MKIVVPFLGTPGPAQAALDRFEFAYEARLVDSGGAYGAMLGDLWREREGFLMIEHDVVPPNRQVIENLLACPEAWCTHAYPSPVLMMSIGVLKMSREALEQSPDLPAVWEGTHWGLVDRAMIPALHARFPLHGHYPPFEHHK